MRVFMWLGRRRNIFICFFFKLFLGVLIWFLMWLYFTFFCCSISVEDFYFVGGHIHDVSQLDVSKYKYPFVGEVYDWKAMAYKYNASGLWTYFVGKRWIVHDYSIVPICIHPVDVIFEMPSTMSEFFDLYGPKYTKISTRKFFRYGSLLVGAWPLYLDGFDKASLLFDLRVGSWGFFWSNSVFYSCWLFLVFIWKVILGFVGYLSILVFFLLSLPIKMFYILLIFVKWFFSLGPLVSSVFLSENLLDNIVSACNFLFIYSYTNFFYLLDCLVILSFVFVQFFFLAIVCIVIAFKKFLGLCLFLCISVVKFILHVFVYVLLFLPAKFLKFVVFFYKTYSLYFAFIVSFFIWAFLDSIKSYIGALHVVYFDQGFRTDFKRIVNFWIDIIDRVVDQVTTWMFGIYKKDEYVKIFPFRDRIFRMHVHNRLVDLVSFLAFCYRMFKKLLWRFFYFCLSSSKIWWIAHPLVFYFTLRLSGAKLMIDFSTYEFSWKRFFSVHTFYYALLQVENFFSLFHTFGNPRVQASDEFDSAEKLRRACPVGPVDRRLLQMTSFFRPCNADTDHIRVSNFEFSFYSDILFFILYKLLYYLVFMLMFIFGLIFKFSMAFSFFFNSIKMRVLKGFLRLERMTLYKVLVFWVSFVYILLRLVITKETLMLIFVKVCTVFSLIIQFFIRIKFISVIVTLIKYFYYLIIRGRFFILLFWMFFSLGAFYFCVVFLDISVAMWNYVYPLIYWLLYDWKFVEKFFEAYSTYDNYWRHVDIYAKYWYEYNIARWELWLQVNLVVKFWFFGINFYYSVKAICVKLYVMFLYFFPEVVFYWKYSYYYWIYWTRFQLTTFWTFSMTHAFISKTIFYRVTLGLVVEPLFWFSLHVYKNYIIYIPDVLLYLFFKALKFLVFYVLVQVPFLERVIWYFSETETGCLYVWYFCATFYDMFNFSLMYDFCRGLFWGTFSSQLLCTLAIEFNVFEAICLLEQWFWHFVWKLFDSEIQMYTGYLLKYYQWMRWYIFFDDFLLKYHLKPFSHYFRGGGLTGERIFIFYENLFIEHPRSTNRVPTSGEFFHSPFIHWNIFCSSYYAVAHHYPTLHPMLSRGRGGFLWFDAFVTPRCFFILVIIAFMVFCRGFYVMTTHVSKHYASTQYNWDYFRKTALDTPVVSNALMDLPLKLRELIRNQSKFSDREREHLQILWDLIRSFRVDHSSFLWKLSYYMKIRFNMEEDLGKIKSNFFDFWKYFISFTVPGFDTLNKRRGSSVSLFDNWRGRIEDFIYFVFRFRFEHKKRWYETESEFRSRVLHNVGVLSRRYRGELDLWDFLYDDIEMFKFKLLINKVEWANKKINWAMDSKYRTTKSRLGVVYKNADKIARERFFYTDDLLVDYHPIFRIITSSYIPKDVKWEMIKYGREDFLFYLSDKHEWLYKHGTMDEFNFHMFLAYMYSKSDELAAIHRYMPKFGYEQIEEILDQEFRYEIREREKYLFEPLYKYFWALDEYVFDHKLPYWCIHKDQDNELFSSNKALTSKRKYKRNYKWYDMDEDLVIPFYTASNVKKCMLETFFWWWLVVVWFIWVYLWKFHFTVYANWSIMHEFWVVVVKPLFIGYDWGKDLDLEVANHVFAYIAGGPRNDFNIPREFIEKKSKFLLDVTYPSKGIYYSKYWGNRMDYLIFTNAGMPTDEVYYLENKYLHLFLAEMSTVSSRNSGFLFYQVLYWICVIGFVIFFIRFCVYMFMYIFAEHFLFNSYKKFVINKIHEKKGFLNPRISGLTANLLRLLRSEELNMLYRYLVWYRSYIDKRRGTPRQYPFMSKLPSSLDVRHLYNYLLYERVLADLKKWFASGRRQDEDYRLDCFRFVKKGKKKRFK